MLTNCSHVGATIGAVPDHMGSLAVQERRQYPRRRVFKGAIAYFNHEQSSVDCVVHDLTDVGARLKFESTSFVPNRFNLLITRERTLYPAEVIWRDAKDVGIRFTGPSRPLAPQKLAD